MANAPSQAEQRFKGGVAVVTGGGAGIGAGLARQAGALGMTVIVADISKPGAQAVVESIQRAGGQAEAYQIDVSKPTELDTLASWVFEKYGSVRLLVNNAGIETLGYTWEIPAPRWEATLNINIHGVVHGCRAFIPRMIESGQECWIANLASIGSFAIMPTQTAYIMTKHAVQSFTECLFLEVQLKKLPITVCSVLPGMLKTSIFNADNCEGEVAWSSTFRRTMHDIMANHGMDVDEGCKKIIDGIAAKKFWVETQPEMTQSAVQDRIDFLTDQRDPEVTEEARSLLGLE